MYKIIGADQKEYGPISADQMRQWIREGRVNAQTLAQAEGQADWRPVIAFPEFADVIAGGPGATTTPAALAGGSGREAALAAVNGPAIGLIVTAILGLIAAGLGLVVNVLTMAGVPLGMQNLSDPQMQKYFNLAGGGFGIIQNVIGAVIGVLIWRGAARMKTLENHQFAFTASILAMLPCLSPCCLLGLPFGIWALVVISKPEIKSQFT